MLFRRAREILEPALRLVNSRWCSRDDLQRLRVEVARGSEHTEAGKSAAMVLIVGRSKRNVHHKLPNTQRQIPR